MSAAPPPPPPPPPPKKNVDDLPAELLLSIIQYLQMNDYVTFALAIYPLLQHHGLVPPLSADIYHRITLQRPSSPASQTSSTSASHTLSHWELPIELTEEIMSYLEPADRIAFIFSRRELILEYLPRLDERTKKSLWKSTDKKQDSKDQDGKDKDGKDKDSKE